MDGTQQDPTPSLVESLERMSITVSNHGQQPVPSEGFPTVTNKTLRKPSSSSSLKTRSPDPLQRRSEAHGSPQQASSPSQSRRQSGIHNSQQGQGLNTPAKPTFRRTSSMTNSPKNMSHHAFSVSIHEDKPPSVTASSVACEHFRNELALHSESTYDSPNTLVIIHDACYGHRFSRPKTTKANLGLIVERPERIQASIAGIASAYVRLGGRHAEGDHALHPSRPPNRKVPFGIRKSSRSVPLTAPVVASVHGTKWMQELTGMCNAAGEKLASGSKELARPDTPGGGLSKPKLHEGDLYLCRDSLDALQGALGGVLDAVDAVFRSLPDRSDTSSVPTDAKRAFVCVRPPGHHCSADLPSGFCWLNNVHVGIEHAAQTYGLTHAAIIDFDLHHGDGSQAITWERNTRTAKASKTGPQSKKTSIGYFSLHDINSYPCEYGDMEKVQSASLCLENAHNQTIWNVHLQPWKSEAEFWALYETRYLILLEKAKSYLKTQTQRLRASSPNSQPKSAIFISAGFDASEHEGEGMQRHKVNVPTEFYARYTRDILRIAVEDDTSVAGRVISVLEGGYSDRALMSGVLSHISGLTTAIAAPSTIVNGSPQPTVDATSNYDKCWWDIGALHELETLLNPTTSPVAKKTKSSELSTFASPTESFAAKVVDPSKVYRSLSGVASVLESSRAPTPPAPEVGWATAAHELGKLLTPSDRQIHSCRHEDLNEPKPKPKPKRDRHSTIGLTSETTAEKMQTRARKAKLPTCSVPETSNGATLPLRKVPDDDRRRTISDLPTSDDPAPSQPDRPTTSDSEARSAGSVKSPAASRASSRDTSPAKAAREVAKVHRTRRASGAKADFVQRDVDVKAPPVPRLPTKYGPTTAGPPRFKREGTVKSSGSTEIDRLTNGVKKFTLKMPAKASESSTVSPLTAAVAKPERKPAVPYATMPKPGLPKNATSRPMKPTKAGNPTTDGLNAQAEDAAKNEVAQVSAEADANSDVTPEAPQPPSADPLHAVHSQDPSSQILSSSANTPAEAHFSKLDTTSSLTASEKEEIQRGIAHPLAPTTIDATQPSSHSVAQAPTPPPEIFDKLSSTQFIPYNPSRDFSAAPSLASGAYAGTQASLKWLPPNEDAPAQIHDKPNEMKISGALLPTFSATGTIPFAAVHRKEISSADATAGREMSQVETKAIQTIWDVPATPGG